MNPAAKELGTQLEATASRIGVALNADIQHVREFSAQRMTELAAIIGEDGYQDALVAATMRIAMEAAGAAVFSADDIDREIVGTIAGGLAVGARLLAGSPA